MSGGGVFSLQGVLLGSLEVESSGYRVSYTRMSGGGVFRPQGVLLGSLEVEYSGHRVSYYDVWRWSLQATGCPTMSGGGVFRLQGCPTRMSGVEWVSYQDVWSLQTKYFA